MIKEEAKPSHTVVALGNPVLYPPSFSQVGNLGPVLVRVGRRTESAASALSRILWWGLRSLSKSGVLHVVLEHRLSVVVGRVVVGHVVVVVREVI